MTNALANLGKAWDKDIVPVLHAQTLARKLIPRSPLSGKGLGMTSVETRAYTATAGAVINYEIIQDNEEKVDITAKTLKIPVQQDDRIISRRAWESYILHGTPIDNDLALDMVANIAAQEDALVINGWAPDGSNYEIKGMYQVANNTVSGSDFGTYGNAIATVAEGLALLRADKIYSAGYNLLLHPTQYAELEASESSTGKSEYDRVLAMLNRNAPGNPGKIYETTNLAAGTGIIAPVGSPANRRFFDLVIAVEPFHDLWIEGSQKTGDIHVRQLGALAPRFKHLNESNKDDCICTLTSI
ncbi:MAG: encapsulin [Candidatus Methanospirareceae archaeon]